MKVADLIEKLMELPQDASVVVMDGSRWHYEAARDCGPNSEGLYYNLEIEYNNESFFHFDSDAYEDAPIPTVVISFESDYEEKVAELAAATAVHDPETLSPDSCCGACESCEKNA